MNDDPNEVQESQPAAAEPTPQQEELKPESCEAASTEGAQA